MSVCTSALPLIDYAARHPALHFPPSPFNYSDATYMQMRSYLGYVDMFLFSLLPFSCLFSFPGLLGELIQQALQSMVGFDAWHAHSRHPSSPYVCTSIKSELLECEPESAPASQLFPSNNCQALGPVHTVSLLPSYVGVLIAIWKLFWHEDHAWLSALYSPTNIYKIRP
ncbi:uncharacterized [Tachysurus ichikawai]